MSSGVVTASYGRGALDALRAVVSDAKAGDRMAPVTILVPNNIAGVVARRHLAGGLGDGGPGGGGLGDGGPGGGGLGDGGTGGGGPGDDGRPVAAARAVAGLFIATLARLAEQLAAPNLAPRRPATRPIVAAAWRSALDLAAGGFETVKQHPATIRALASADRELRDLSPAGLQSVGRASSLSSEVVRLHEKVARSLADSWYDVSELLHTGATLIAQDPRIVRESGAIVLYLPQSLTRAESAFARALADHADLTVVVGLTGVRRADLAVRRTLDRLGLDQPDGTAAVPVATRVLHASDSDDEVRCVVRDVVATLATTSAHRIAVLYGNAIPYARLLHEHLAGAEIAANGRGTRAVHERAIARAFLGLLSVADGDLPRADVFRALTDAPTLAFGDDRVPVARWERISRLAGIVGGGDWQRRLQTFADAARATVDTELSGPEPSRGRVDAARRDIDAASGLQRFTATLSEQLDAGSRLTHWSSLSAWALALFHELYGDPSSLLALPVEEQYAAATIERTLRGLGGLDEFDASPTLGQLREVLELELEAALPRVGRFGEGVYVGPVASAVGLDADVVYVVGLAEDAFPGRLHEDALLPERVRDVSNGELPAAREQIDDKHRHLLAAFTAAPTVVASFPRGDLRRSTQRLPSRWLLDTLRALTDQPGLSATEWDRAGGDLVRGSPSHAAELRATDVLSSEQEWRVRAASAGLDLDDPTIAAAVAMTRARMSPAFTRFDGNLQGSAGLPDFARSGRLVSPTSLEAYASCPHAYFVERMLRVEPLEQPEEIVTISALDLGTLIHESMDEFVRQCGDGLPSYGEAWTATQRDRLKEIATAKSQVFEDRGVTGHRLLWEHEQARILIDLDMMLTDDNSWRAARDARVVASELTFGKDGAEPVIVDISTGRVRMVGSADKVDETRDGVLLVTDIKTGSPDRFKVLRDDPVAAGTKLQLPVYGYAARQLLDGDQVIAQYWFVRKGRGERIPLTLDDKLETTYAETIDTLVTAIAQGQFPAKPPDTDDFGYVRCRYCNPDAVGYQEVRDRWKHKRHDPALEALVRLIDPDALEDGADAP